MMTLFPLLSLSFLLSLFLALLFFLPFPLRPKEKGERERGEGNRDHGSDSLEEKILSSLFSSFSFFAGVKAILAAAAALIILW